LFPRILSVSVFSLVGPPLRSPPSPPPLCQPGPTCWPLPFFLAPTPRRDLAVSWNPRRAASVRFIDTSGAHRDTIPFSHDLDQSPLPLPLPLAKYFFSFVTTIYGNRPNLDPLSDSCRFGARFAPALPL
jgi:hypothetical protein